ncbi:MAG TPA: NRDE family protein [Thermoanaerobaculia bacterium]
MCLIIASWKVHPSYRLVVAANRDEELARPTRAALFWPEVHGVLAGKDLLSGGTWMGVSSAGRFAAVTNFHEQLVRDPDAPSRGLLVLDFLRGDQTPNAYAEEVDPRAGDYGGFGLFVGNRDALCYVTNQRKGFLSLEPGIYGLSNSYLDDPWPKVVKAKGELDQILREKKSDKIVPSLLTMLADRARPDDESALDRSPIFISGDGYGTRSSTVLLMFENGETIFAEKGYDAGGKPNGLQMFRIVLNPGFPQ